MVADKEKDVLISGKFAVIHSGHIRLFIFAKTIGKRLTVAIDVDGLSDEEREFRINFLKNQNFIDKVITFRSDLESVILEVKPDFVLKGSEFSSKFNVESEILSSYGGELIFSSGSTFVSETDMFNNEEIYTINLSSKIPIDFLKRNNIELKDIKKQISQFHNTRVCVIGDLIIDEYINCHPIGMSREEPTLVVTPIDSQKFLGGAGIVAAHTAALGAKTTLISIIGNDESGSWGSAEATRYGVSFKAITDKTRPTNLKQRYRSGSHSLLKVSHLSQDKVTKFIQDQIISEFVRLAPSIDLLILSDFSYGVFTKEVAEILINIAKENKVLVSADSQTSSQVGDLSQFMNVNLITPTEIEARVELKDYSSGLAVIAENLRIKLNPQVILIKVGADGLVIGGINSNGESIVLDALPSLNLNPIDVSGAGDSLLAAASLALFVEYSPSKAALIGTIAAAIQISRIGNIPINSEQLLKAIES